MSIQLVEPFVMQLKSQGVFDAFRKECLADVDTKPAYQNLRSRVQTVVEQFHHEHQWSPGLNRNQLRESLRKCIVEKTNLDSGISRIVEQIVNPKIIPSFLPVIEQALEEFMEQNGVSEGPGDSDDSGLGGGGGGSHGPGGGGKRLGDGGHGGGGRSSGSYLVAGRGRIMSQTATGIRGKTATSLNATEGAGEGQTKESSHHRHHRRKSDKDKKRKSSRGRSLDDIVAATKKRVIPQHILSDHARFERFLPQSCQTILKPPARNQKFPKLPNVGSETIKNGPVVFIMRHRLKKKANSDASDRHGGKLADDLAEDLNPKRPRLEMSASLDHSDGIPGGSRLSKPALLSIGGNDFGSQNGFDMGGSRGTPSVPHSAPVTIKDGDKQSQFFAALNTPAEAYIKKKKKKLKSGDSDRRSRLSTKADDGKTFGKSQSIAL